MNWVSLSLKLNWVQCTIKTFQNMNAEVLNYSSDQIFPLENILQEWICKMVGIQATLSKKHVKSVLTF